MVNCAHPNLNIMEDLLTFSLTVFTSFFAITNPISNMTIFLSLTDGASKKVKKDINKRATIVAFIIVALFVLLGKIIFELFHITIPAFKIFGGILVFLTGFDLLQSKKSSVKHLKTVDVDENIAISPLTIPMILCLVV